MPSEKEIEAAAKIIVGCIVYPFSYEENFEYARMFAKAALEAAEKVREEK